MSTGRPVGVDAEEVAGTAGLEGMESLLDESKASLDQKVEVSK
jgi:hypothetical protein